MYCFQQRIFPVLSVSFVCFCVVVFSIPVFLGLFSFSPPPPPLLFRRGEGGGGWTNNYNTKLLLLFLLMAVAEKAVPSDHNYAFRTYGFLPRRNITGGHAFPTSSFKHRKTVIHAIAPLLV